jgi:hypothetical protein
MNAIRQSNRTDFYVQVTAQYTLLQVQYFDTGQHITEAEDHCGHDTASCMSGI